MQHQLSLLYNRNFLYFSEENLWGSIQLPLKVNDIKGLVSLEKNVPVVALKLEGIWYCGGDAVSLGLFLNPILYSEFIVQGSKLTVALKTQMVVFNGLLLYENHI